MEKIVPLMLVVLFMATQSNALSTYCKFRIFMGWAPDTLTAQQRLDLDNNGFVSFDEDRASITGMDTNNDNRTSRDEFVNRVMNNLCIPGRQASYLFDMADTNKDGFLTLADVNRASFGENGYAVTRLATGLASMIRGFVKRDRAYEALADKVVLRYDSLIH